MDWFPAVMTLVGVLIGVGIQEFRIWRARKDKYGDMVFEKRLDAHQGAYYWCKRLTVSVRPDRLLRDGGVEAGIKEVWRGLEWLDKNALYLDEDSRLKVNNFIVYIAGIIVRYRDKKWRKNIEVEEEMQKVLEKVVEVVTSIERGIGVKYLPEQKIPIVSIESIEMQKIYDEFLEEMIKDTQELKGEKKG
jgi:hypothetical protein